MVIIVSSAVVSLPLAKNITRSNRGNLKGYGNLEALHGFIFTLDNWTNLYRIIACGSTSPL